jgi:hypothetical protein
MAAASKKDVATQLSITASIANSSPIVGSATLMDEPIKGVRKEAEAEDKRATLFTPEELKIPTLKREKW